jgi:hypothetical protein
LKVKKLLMEKMMKREKRDDDEKILKGLTYKYKNKIYEPMGEFISKPGTCYRPLCSGL